MDWEERMAEIREILRGCTLCEFQCNIDRLGGQTGICRLDIHTYYLRDFINIWPEVGPLPCYSILLNGCYFQCPYCIIGNLLQHPHSGFEFYPQNFQTRINLLYENGITNLIFLGGEPVIHILTIYDLLRNLPATIRKNLYSYLYLPVRVIKLLVGVFDLFIVEYRYGNDECAWKYSSAKGYNEILRRNLLYLVNYSEVVVRHLLLPGHLDCCFRPMVDWLASNLPQVKLSLGNEYLPSYKAWHYPEINRRVSQAEYQLAISMALERGLELIYRYLPPHYPTDA